MLTMLKSFKNVYFSQHFKSCFALLQCLESVRSSTQKHSWGSFLPQLCRAPHTCFFFPYGCDKKDEIEHPLFS